MNPVKDITTIMIACPVHHPAIHHNVSSRIHQPSSRKDLAVMKLFSSSSLLANNFNRILATAHNWNNQKPDEKIKWMFILHGDIIPEVNWVDKMIDLAEKHGTDLLSVVVPFKDQSGITSTALATDDPYQVKARLTLRQLQELPPTFDNADLAKLMGHTGYPIPHLLVNSGCIIFNLEWEHATEVWFTIRDEMRIDTTGKYYAAVESEDWFFSRMVQSLGGKVMATREVQVAHVGGRHYRNDQVWGAQWDEALLGPDYGKTELTDRTIWTLDEAKVMHVHSPGLAQWLADNLDKTIPVIDLGCGKGTYLKKLIHAGFSDVVGLEGTPGINEIADIDFILEKDITKPLNSIISSDKRNLICLEVMEHIHPDDEAKVLENIKTICNNVLVLSWAIEGQNGHGHINCRSGVYVVNAIHKLGFKMNLDLTKAAREAAIIQGTEFFEDTLYVFNRVQ